MSAADSPFGHDNNGVPVVWDVGTSHWVNARGSVRWQVTPARVLQPDKVAVNAADVAEAARTCRYGHVSNGALANRLDAALAAQSEPVTDEDPEVFCPACFAGMESSEHHEKCVAPADEPAEPMVGLNPFARRPKVGDTVKAGQVIGRVGGGDGPRAEGCQEFLAPEPATDEPCPTCSGPFSRETTGMVCQTCGTDYAPEPADQGEERWPVPTRLTGRTIEEAITPAPPADRTRDAATPMSPDQAEQPATRAEAYAMAGDAAREALGVIAEALREVSAPGRVGTTFRDLADRIAQGG